MPDNHTASGPSTSVPQTIQVIGQPVMGIQSLYANGFIINLSAADISIVTLLDNIPIATIALSFTTAKSLCEQLCEAIKKLESATKNDIMTINVLQEALKNELKAQGT